MLKSISSIVSLVFVRSLHFTSILLTVFINHSTLAQVVIQEEVVLDTQLEVESVSLTMPFYGQVSGCVNWGAIWNGGLKDVVITAGNQTKTMGFGCLAGYVYCTWYIQNVPLDTDVDITVYGSCEDGQLIEAETQLISTGTNEYSVEYYDIWGNWTLATTVKFTATTPPACDDGFLCTTSQALPEINLVQRENGFSSIDICGEPDLMSGFLPVPAGYDYVLPYEISVCFNSQTQLWQFSFDNQNSILFNIIIDMCPDNITHQKAILINDYNNFPPEYGCDNIIRDIKKHYEYPMKSSGSYVLESIWLAHEERHKLHFQGVIDEILNDSFDELLESKDCQELQNASEAKNYYEGKASLLIPAFWKKANKIDEDRTGLTALYRRFFPDDKPMWRHERFIHSKIYSLIDKKLLQAILFYNCWKTIFP